MDDSKGTLKSLLDQIKMANNSLSPKQETVKADTGKEYNELKKSNELLTKIEEAILGNTESIKVLPKNIASQISVKLSDISVPEQEKTGTESLKELVGDLKSGFQSIERGINNTFNKGFNFLSDPLGSIKDSLKNISAKSKERIEGAKEYIRDVATTKAGYTAEEGRFVEQFKKQNQQLAFGVSKEERDKLTEEGTAGFRQTKDIEEKIKATEAEIAKSKKFGFEAAPEDTQKLEELKKLKDEVDVRNRPEDKIKEVQAKQTKNEEADNVISAQESIADSFKNNNELIKSLLDTTKEQLVSINVIKESLAPKEPTDEQDTDKQKKQKFYEDVSSKLTEISGKLDNVGSGSEGKGLLDSATDLLGGKGKTGPAGTAGKAVGRFSKLAAIGRVGGAALAVAGGAFTAYEGYTAAEDSKNAKLEEVQAKLNSGEIDEKQAASLRKEIGNTATVQKSGAVGEGVGMAAGGIAGMKLGAALGSFAGPVGTVVGGVAGGALGAFAGSSLGKKAGEFGGKVLNYFSDDKKELPSKSPTEPYTQTKQEQYIADELVTPGKPLSEKQMAVIGMSKSMGNSYSPEIEAQYAKQKAAVTESIKPVKNEPSQLGKISIENADMAREGSKAPTSAPIIMNSSSNSNTTSYVPMKSTPRADQAGSPLDRYQSRISVF